MQNQVYRDKRILKTERKTSSRRPKQYTQCIYYTTPQHLLPTSIQLNQNSGIKQQKFKFSASLQNASIPTSPVHTLWPAKMHGNHHQYIIISDHKTNSVTASATEQ